MTTKFDADKWLDGLVDQAGGLEHDIQRARLVTQPALDELTVEQALEVLRTVLPDWLRHEVEESANSVPWVPEVSA